MDETTSLILKRYFKKPISAPASPPTISPMITTSGFASTAFKLLYPAMILAVNPAASICPETPILNRPARSATATANAAKIIGVK